MRENADYNITKTVHAYLEIDLHLILNLINVENTHICILHTLIATIQNVVK